MGVKMMKRLFLLLIFSLIGVIVNPSILAANKIEKINSPVLNDPETIIEEKIAEEAPITSEIETLVSKKQPETSAYIAPNNITIMGKTVPLVQTGSTDIVYDYVASRYGEKFIYGHNSAAVFGVLYSAGVGQSFSTTMNGITKNYMISDIVVYEKNQSSYLLQLNGRGNYMNSVAAAIKKSINESTSQVTLSYYDLSIMTCYGTMLGGGDATHRLVIFANEI